MRPPWSSLRQALGGLLLLSCLFQTRPGATETLALRRGQFRGSSYAAVAVDPRHYRLEVLAYGRQGERWTSDYRALEDLPRDCLAALNGTFFSLRWNEPAGVLVYRQGREQWTPHFKRPYATGAPGRAESQERPVASLKRWYLAIYANGQVRIGNSGGQSVERLRGQIEPPALSALLGGGGRLVAGGRRAISAETLAGEGFDDRSGLRPAASVPRTGLGLDERGRVLLVTAGLEGGGLALEDFAELLISLGAREALFLDCGSSTAMAVGKWRRGGGRALPTWLVARPLSPGQK